MSGKMYKIVITGPESTGKTALAKELAAYFNTAYIPEFAREYVEKLAREYSYEDVEFIAHKQIALEKEMLSQSPEILFFDTGLIITKIWFQHKYSKVPGWLTSYIKNWKVDLFLLCRPDLPWEFDPVRENPHIRNELFELYKQELDACNFYYEIIEGKGEKRFANALEACHKIIKNPGRI